jgi:hypothetical protein
MTDARESPRGSAASDSSEEPELGRPVLANALVADTNATAREDHTFCGVMFPVQAVAHRIPFDAIKILSVAVRGGLGPVSIYASKQSYRDVHSDGSKWERIYGPVNHAPAWQAPQPLVLDRPLVVPAGETVALYVHSEAPGDLAIIYDNARAPICFADEALHVLSGAAHISNRPFELRGPWGGSGWRDRRSFVGQITYSFQQVLWSPKSHPRYPPKFRHVVRCLLYAKPVPAPSSASSSCEAPGLCRLPRDVLFHVVSFLSWDDFERLALTREDASSDLGEGPVRVRRMLRCPALVRQGLSYVWRNMSALFSSMASR